MQCIPTTYILALAKKAYGMKLDLLTNASVVDDAMRFVSEHNNNKKEVKEKDISSVVAAVVAEEEEETTTTNQVF